MRVSVVEGDPGFRHDLHLYHVYFNGVERKDVMTADEENGAIEVFKRNDDGSIMMGQDGTSVQTEVLLGHVRIEEFKPINKQVAYGAPQSKWK